MTPAYMAAKQRLISVCLQRAARDFQDPDAHHADDLEYLDEEIHTAAQQLVTQGRKPHKQEVPLIATDDPELERLLKQEEESMKADLDAAIARDHWSQPDPYLTKLQADAERED